MKNFKTIDPQDLTTREVHKILLNAVTPRPIALASTIDKNGNVNLSPFSYFNVFSAAPPILVFSPANRVTDNSNIDPYESSDFPLIVLEAIISPVFKLHPFTV